MQRLGIARHMRQQPDEARIRDAGLVGARDQRPELGVGDLAARNRGKRGANRAHSAASAAARLIAPAVSETGVSP